MIDPRLTTAPAHVMVRGGFRAVTTEHFNVTTTVAKRRVLDILCNALDSNAIGYWIARGSLRRILPKSFDVAAIDWLDADDKAFFRDVSKDYFAPLVEGGALKFREDDLDGTERTLDLDAIKRGLEIMARDEPRHFSDLVNETDDVTTADVFVQCCVLGEVVYG